MILTCKDKKLDLALPKIMGILNVTPDSFSDGGSFFQRDKAIEQAHTMLLDGADIIDIGGESTRPGADVVSSKDEIERVIPIIRALQTTSVPLSIDTSKPEVMLAAVEAGASIINDVNALRAKGALEVAAELNVPVCLMHMKGTPDTMQQSPQYGNVVEEIKQFLGKRIDAALSAGIAEANIIIDPGFGFGKTCQHNITLLKQLADFLSLKKPLLVGLSRKRFLGEITARGTLERIPASISAAMIAAQQGAHILRVHDVAETRDMLNVLKTF
ncbi:MAG TPA: dihydropteroate synthase [Aeromonadales bacterium]|nr:dihydropteroate synthase [Aeromonadales bacterium]